MTAYILKDGELDGIYDGIGVVEVGVPIEPRNETHAAALAAHPAFKQHRAAVKDAPLTTPDTVEAEEAPAPTRKTAKSGDKE